MLIYYEVRLITCCYIKQFWHVLLLYCVLLLFFERGLYIYIGYIKNVLNWGNVTLVLCCWILPWCCIFNYQVNAINAWWHMHLLLYRIVAQSHHRFIMFWVKRLWQTYSTVILILPASPAGRWKRKGQTFQLSSQRCAPPPVTETYTHLLGEDIWLHFKPM